MHQDAVALGSNQLIGIKREARPTDVLVCEREEEDELQSHHIERDHLQKSRSSNVVAVAAAEFQDDGNVQAKLYADSATAEIEARREQKYRTANLQLQDSHLDLEQEQEQANHKNRLAQSMAASELLPPSPASSKQEAEQLEQLNKLTESASEMFASQTNTKSTTNEHDRLINISTDSAAAAAAATTTATTTISNDQQKSKPAHCAGCQGQIRDKFIFSVIDLFWHQACVRCADCSLKLNDRCYTFGGKLYCRHDYWRRFGPKCYSCELPIGASELVQRIKGTRVYHLKCFACDECQRPLEQGEQLHLVDDKRLMCKQDFQKRQIQGGDSLSKQPDHHHHHNQNHNHHNQNHHHHHHHHHNHNSNGSSYLTLLQSSKTASTASSGAASQRQKRASLTSLDNMALGDEDNDASELQARTSSSANANQDLDLEGLEEEEEEQARDELDLNTSLSIPGVEFGGQEEDENEENRLATVSQLVSQDLEGHDLDQELLSANELTSSKQAIKQQHKQVNNAAASKRKRRRRQRGASDLKQQVQGAGGGKQAIKSGGKLSGSMGAGVRNGESILNGSSMTSMAQQQQPASILAGMQATQLATNQQQQQLKSSSSSSSSSTISSSSSNHSTSNSSGGHRLGPSSAAAATAAAATLQQHHHHQAHHQSSNSNNSTQHQHHQQATGHKPTRVRTVLNEKQLQTLRDCYAHNPRPDALMKEQLVDMTGLSPRVIRVWFQNKRCKDKKKSILYKQMQQHEKDGRHLAGLTHIRGVPMVASSPVQYQDDHSSGALTAANTPLGALGSGSNDPTSPQQQQQSGAVQSPKSAQTAPSATSQQQQQPVEIHAYQPPWKGLAEYAQQQQAGQAAGNSAAQQDRLNTSSPRYVQLIGQVHGYGPAAGPEQHQVAGELHPTSQQYVSPPGNSNMQPPMPPHQQHFHQQHLNHQHTHLLQQQQQQQQQQGHIHPLSQAPPQLPPRPPHHQLAQVAGHHSLHQFQH